MPLCPDKKNICAIVVAHSPNEEFESNIRAILGQVQKVVVVNNGAKNISLPNIHLISNNKNLGQGKALNQGAEFAAKNGFKWILLLDQDSLVKPDMVEKEIEAFKSCHFKELVGIIGTNCIFKNTNEIKYRNSSKEIFFERDVVMTSGMLLSVDAFIKTGPFREEFFIDSIDADYCLRARKNGFKIIVSYEAMMVQRVGTEGKMKRFLWKKILVTNHSAERCYYMTRNGLILVREYFFSEPYWCLRRLAWYFAVKPMFVIFYEKEKIKKIKFIIKGYWHAFKNGKNFYHNPVL